MRFRVKRFRKFPTIATITDWQWPPSLSLEQASSEATALYKQSLVSGNTLADLTGGMGIDTLFLSKKFNHTFYVEQNNELCTLAKHNFSLFQDREITTICSTAEDFLQQGGLSSCNKAVDCIYIDPARRKEGQKMVSLADCSPDITQLYPILQQHTKQLLLKLSPMLDISLALRQLPHTRQIHIVSVGDEVKELLMLIDFTLQPTDNPELIVSVLNPLSDENKNHKSLKLNIKDEQQATVTFCSKESLTSNNNINYLYEPHPALLKAGLFRWICSKYDILKLAPNTHLYVSNNLINDFGGNIYKIERETTKKQVKGLQCAVLVRNYPIGAEQIRKEWGLKEPYSDNRTYLICTKQDTHKKVFLAEKMQ